MDGPIRRNAAAAAVASAFWVLAWLAVANAALAAPPNAPDSGPPIPAVFEENRGQADPHVKFLARGGGYSLFITAANAVLVDRRTGGAVRVRLLGAQPNGEVAGLEPLPGRIHYLRGRDPAGWRTNVPTYARVAYREAYPGIDAVYKSAAGSRFEQEFLLRPNADPAAIRLAFDGVQSVAVDAAGKLVLATGGAPVRLDRPVAYQEVGGTRRAVSAAWRRRGPNEVGFQIGTYDRSRALVIDPIITWATYLGGSENDQGFAIAVDSAGNSYITGDTKSANFPTTDGSQLTLGSVITIPCQVCGGSGSCSAVIDDGCPFTIQEPSIDVFVTKLNPTGQALVYSVFIGGSGDEGGRGIAVDPDGNAYVAGFTSSPDFPTTAGAFQMQPGGGLDAFVLKLGPSGSLVYATYLGGRDDDVALGIAVDAAGRAYVTGGTRSPDFPVVDAFQSSPGGFDSRNAFVARLSAQGSVEYSTYLGGDLDAVANATAVDNDGNAYVTGSTGGSFPTTPGSLQPEFGGGVDAFVARINPDATLGWATYLGGRDMDVGFGIAVDGDGRPRVVGSTVSSNFPATDGDRFTGDAEGFVLRMAANGRAIDWSRNTGTAVPVSVALGAQGRAHLVGSDARCTEFAEFDGTVPVPCRVATIQVTVETRDAAGERLSLDSFGGTCCVGDFGQAIAVSGSSLWLTGISRNMDFPVTPGAVQRNKPGGDADAFVVRMGEPVADAGGSSAESSPNTGSSASVAEAADGGGSGQKCFIATAAFGSPFVWQVATLRRFRDRALLPHAPGRLLVRVYYRLSPPLARAVAEQPLLAAGVRALLTPVAGGADFAMNRPALAMTLVGFGLAAIVGIGVTRRKNTRRLRTVVIMCPLLAGLLLVLVFALTVRHSNSRSTLAMAPTMDPSANAPRAPVLPGSLQVAPRSQTTQTMPDLRALGGGKASITPLNPFAAPADRRFAVSSELIEGVLSAKGFAVTDPRRARAFGIEAGDTIVRINGYPPTGLVAVLTTLQRDPDQAAVVLEIDRNGTRLVQSHRVR